MNEYLKTFQNRETVTQFVKVGLVGVVNTIATFTIFNLGRSADLSITVSLMIAFAVATVMSYFLNRRWSFQLNDSGENLSESWKFFAINGVAWAITESLMRVVQAWFGPLTRFGENFALLAISGVILLPKFASYRDGVFGRALTSDDEERAPIG